MPHNDLKDISQEDLAKILQGEDPKTNNDHLSTILTDPSIRPDELKKQDEAKKSQSIGENAQNTIIYDTNINEIDDLINIMDKGEFDFIALEPNREFVKVSCKKNNILKEVKYIHFPVYLNLVLKSKTISALSLENTTTEQKGSGNYVFNNKNYDVLVKTSPSSFGEILFFKSRVSEKKAVKKSVKKSGVSLKAAFGFLGAILFIALVIGASFISFVVMNAQTPEDVAFFANLGISLNDINNFLQKLTTVVFMIVVMFELILLVLVLFKALFTKKHQRAKKIALSLLSVLLLIITGATGVLWMSLDKTIRGLPNWLELSYGVVQVFDNNLLNNNNIGREGAIIQDFNNIIGPIDLKFDLTYLQKEEQRSGFRIEKYIWDFGDGNKVESQTPEMIHSFDQKKNYPVSLTLEGYDARGPQTKPAGNIPQITIAYLIDIEERTLGNGGKTISFHADDLRPLGEIEWYSQDDSKNPVSIGYTFSPGKVYFDSELIGMRIKNSPSPFMTRIFTINGDTSSLDGKIEAIASYNNDLEYTFKVIDLENNFGDGFVESFTWDINNEYFKKVANIEKPSESSSIKYVFSNYGIYNISVEITTTGGKTTTLNTSIQVHKKTSLKNFINFNIDGKDIPTPIYNKLTNEYSLFDVGVPTKIEFDAKKIQVDNSQYIIGDIQWIIGDDPNIFKTKTLEYDFNHTGYEKIEVLFTLQHKNNKNDTIRIKEIINIEFVKKDFMINLEVKPNSEYVPALVSFDASRSYVEGDNIIKFIYDYGDGVKEERDAINPGHQYLKAGTYNIKLTILTAKGKEYTTSELLILKEPQSNAKIVSSIKKAPIGQEISFYSTQSTGQIVKYHWRFGDGNISTEANPSYTYKKPGTYKVILTLDLANNNIISDEMEITITD